VSSIGLTLELLLLAARSRGLRIDFFLLGSMPLRTNVHGARHPQGVMSASVPAVPFPHHQLREYLAARGLDMPDGASARKVATGHR
jgi:hypothetical protein